MIEYDFTRKNAGRADVEKFICSTDEFKEVSTRIMTLGVDEPIEFFIERDYYSFDIFVKYHDDVLVSYCNEKFVFNIKLLIDIRLFDTESKIYIPSPIDEIEIIGSTDMVSFNHRCIGGIYLSDSQKVIVTPYLFTDLVIKQYPLYGDFISKNGDDLRYSLFKDCEILQIRHLYNIDNYNELIKNGNKICKINNFNLSVKLKDLLSESCYLNYLEDIKHVLNWNISIMFTNSSLHDFTYKSYMDDVLKVVDKFKQLNLDSYLMVEFIPAIIYNTFKNRDTEYKQLLYDNLLKLSDSKRNFGVYLS